VALVIPTPIPDWPRREAWGYDSTKPLPGQVGGGFFGLCPLIANIPLSTSDMRNIAHANELSEIRPPILSEGVLSEHRNVAWEAHKL